MLSWFKKKKNFNNLKYEDISNAKITLSEKEEIIESQIASYKEEVQKYMELGRKEKDYTYRMVYAKKIQYLNEEIATDYNRIMYLIYNMKLLNKLKIAIEDNDFISNVNGIELNKLLQDQKGLAQFLNKTLNRKIKSEEVLTNADDIFEEVKSNYEENDQIYGFGKGNEVDQIMAQFEVGNDLDTNVYVNESKEVNNV